MNGSKPTAGRRSRSSPEQANDVETIDRAIALAKSQTAQPTLIAIRSTIGYGSPEAGTFKTHGEPLGKNMEATRKALHWDVPPFTVPDEPAAFFREALPKGAALRSRMERALRRVERRERRARGAVRTRARRKASRRSAVAGVHRGERRGRDARGRRDGDERASPRRSPSWSAARPISTRRRRRTSKIRATSSPATTPGGTSTSACASTR